MQKNNNQRYRELSLLIVSNNILSTTDNNGKTLLSCVGGIPKDRVAQLYIDERHPEIVGYRYFKLSDKDVAKGRLLGKRMRGKEIFANERASDGEELCLKGKNQGWKPLKNYVPKNKFTRLAREALWKGGWKSKQLDRWLDDIYPNVVLFVAGDTMFTYSIYNYIVSRYEAKGIIYITDDYLSVPPSGILDGLRLRCLKKIMTNAVNKCNSFFTVSEKMSIEYRQVFNKESFVLHNIPSSIYDEKLSRLSEKNNTLHFVYAGNHYFGRGNILLELGKVIDEVNALSGNKQGAVLDIYFSMALKKKDTRELERLSSVVIHEKVGTEELRRIYNMANILVFVESFDKEQIRQVRLSLSTKIPEYLSLKKPILAIGPDEDGSMEFLKEGAYCVNDLKEINEAVSKLIKSKAVRDRYAFLANCLYENIGNGEEMKEKFIKCVV